MSEQSGEKSEDATPQRKEKAREEGQVAFSQDLSSAAMLILGVVLVRSYGPEIINVAARFMRHQLSDADSLVFNEEDLYANTGALMSMLGKAMFPIVGFLAIGGILSSVFQVGILFVPSRLVPDLKRLNPLTGIGRILSLQGAMKLGFGMFKVSIVSIVATVVLTLRYEEVIYASSLTLRELSTFILDVTLSTTLWVGIALLTLALFDFAYQKWKHNEDLKMTRQEVVDEMKNMQGDPQVMARRRQVQRQMALERMGDKVPQADVIVTNPTELAIAIQYDPEEMAAPIVLVKGAGLIAQRIRRLALEHNIPVVERKPLAQQLFRDVEPGHPVPDESYAAVAEVLAYVYQLQGKKAPAPPKVA